MEDGQVYLLLLGAGLWKFGYVSNKNSLKKRIKEHKHESIEKIKDFIGFNQKKATAVLFWNKITKTPRGYEEKISQLINNLAADNYIDLFKNIGDNNNIREYFSCIETQYIIDEVIPMLDNIRI